jgi:GGDEF domain-containing protein
MMGSKKLPSIALPPVKTVAPCLVMHRRNLAGHRTNGYALRHRESARCRRRRQIDQLGQFGFGVNKLSLSCSIGVSLCPNHGSLGSLLKAADQAMHGVKQLGRKGVAMTESPEA